MLEAKFVREPKVGLSGVTTKAIPMEANACSKLSIKYWIIDMNTAWNLFKVNKTVNTFSGIPVFFFLISWKNLLKALQSEVTKIRA